MELAGFFAPESSKARMERVNGVKHHNDPKELAMEVDIIVSLAIAAVVLFCIAQGSRIIRSAAMHKTLRSAIERDQPLDADLIDRFDKVAEPGAIDQRIGFVLVAAALALLAAGLIQGDVEKLRNMATAAMFPLFVGAALLVRLWLVRRGGPDS